MTNNEGKPTSAPDAPPNGTTDAWRAALDEVLARTLAVERALESPHRHGLDEALAARAEALRRLGAVAARADGDAEDEALRELAEGVVAGDRRLRESAAGALAEVRAGLQAVRAGQQGLSGYRGFAGTAPRFTDRRG